MGPVVPVMRAIGTTIELFQPDTPAGVALAGPEPYEVDPAVSLRAEVVVTAGGTTTTVHYAAIVTPTGDTWPATSIVNPTAPATKAVIKWTSAALKTGCNLRLVVEGTTNATPPDTDSGSWGVNCPQNPGGCDTTPPGNPYGFLIQNAGTAGLAAVAFGAVPRWSVALLPAPVSPVPRALFLRFRTSGRQRPILVLALPVVGGVIQGAGVVTGDLFLGPRRVHVARFDLAAATSYLFRFVFLDGQSFQTGPFNT